MRKVVLTLLLFILISLSATSVVLANEGTFRLAGSVATSGRCFAASVYVDGSYRVLITCRGLVMASDPVMNRYVVWAQIGEKLQRLGEVVSGKLSSSVSEKFDGLLVTLEADAYASRPTGATVLSGKLETIDFGTGLATSMVPLVQPTQPTVSQLGGQAGNQATTTLYDGRGAVMPKVEPQQQGRLVSIVVGVLKAILFGFILLLIVVGVMSFLARRKNL